MRRLFIIIFFLTPLLAVDTLNCIANYELTPPMKEGSMMDPIALGDINADGFDDWAFTFYDNNVFYPEDSVQIYFGSDSIDFTHDYSIQAHRIGPVGDVNGDDYDDIAYLRLYINNRYHVKEPKLFLLHGGPSFDFIPDDSCTFVRGTAYYAYYSDIKKMGDINGDGYDDICCGPTWDLGSYISKPSMLPSGSTVGKMFVYLGGDTLSWLPDTVFTPPFDYPDHSLEFGFYWGDYNSLGDVNTDGYDDFSITYCNDSNFGAPPEEQKYLTYIFFGHSCIDSVVSSVDTFFYGRILQDLGDVSNNNNKAFLCDYRDNIGQVIGNGIATADNILDTMISYSSIQGINLAPGDINGDDFEDWIIINDEFQGYYGNTTLDNITDFVLPQDQTPVYFDYTKLIFLGDICGDGYDKLMLIIGESNKYKIYCYSYNAVETKIAQGIPNDHELLNVYPNPFNPTTTINYRLLAVNNVELAVFDINGRWIETLFKGIQEAGSHKVLLNGSNLSSGVYIIRMIAGEQFESKKIVLLK